MLKRLLDFEIRYQARQIGFWVVLIVMIAFGALSVMFPEAFGSTLSGSRIKANGSQMVARGIVSAFMPIIFFGGIFTVTGILRDKTSNMLEIVHATPVSTQDMTLARMTGIFGTIVLALSVFLLAQFFAQFSPNIDKETLGPIQPLYYLQPFFVFTLVNALFVTAFFTLIAGLTQSRVIVLVSTIGLFFLSFMMGLIPNLDAPKWVEALVDPFGSLAYELDTDFWSTDERNSRLLSLTGYVGLNRLVWGFISLGTLALVFKRFKRGLVTSKTKRKKTALLGTGLAYAGVTQTSGFGADVAALKTRTKFEFLTTVRSIPFAILAGLAAALFAVLIIITVFFSPQKLVPTSLFLSRIGQASLLIPMILIISFFSAEHIFRDKGAKFNELLDSTNVSNWTLLVSKWLSLMGIVTFLCAIGMFTGMVIQLVTDSPPIDLSVYFRSTFLNQLPNYLFLASLAIIVQIFVPNRIVGMLVAAGTIIGAEFFLGRLPFYHPLIGFGASTPGQLSEIAPYNNWVNFGWFNFYWLMFITAFGVLGVWLWRRGLRTGLIYRLKNIKPNLSAASASVMAFAIAGFIGSSFYIYQAHDAVEYANSKSAEAKQVKGEKLFAAERDLPRPHTRAVSVDVQIFPKKQEAKIKGTMTLENASGKPITELYVQSPTGHSEDLRQLTIDGATDVLDGKNADGDSLEDIHSYNVRLFKFDPALQDGEKTTVNYEAFYHSPRLADESNISKNGTFLNNYFGGNRVVPIFGPPNITIISSNKRRKLGLEKLPKWPEPKAEGVELNMFGGFTGPADMIDFEGHICTDDSQIPIAPGNLISETKADGRTCRTYKSGQPISNFFSMLSGDYVVTEDSWTAPDGRIIPIRVYHAEAHNYSIDTIIKGVKFGLSHYTEHFGPYQYDYVRILEVPFISFAQAFAGTIPYAEVGFVMDSGEPDDVKTLDNAMLTTLHEIGHQWFGHQLVPGFSRGYNVLSEGLTSYANMDAYEAYYGWDKARYTLEKFTLERMQAGAMLDSEEEEPLALASTQQYLVYEKADWVLWSLKNYIGPQNMREAIKGFLADYGLKGAPYPTTKTLTNVLRDAAGPEFDGLITDQWDRTVWWKLGFESKGGPILSETPDGKWRVTFTLDLDKDIKTEEMETAKSWSEIDGEQLNEPLEIGIYSNEPKKLWSAWTKLETIWVTETNQEVTLILDGKPSYIAIDPRRLLQERNVDDNVQMISEDPAFTR